MMKTQNLRQSEQHGTLSKMEAIAYGVQARFEESTGYSKRVAEATMKVARALGVPETEIKNWATQQARRSAQEKERLMGIKGMMDKACVIPLAHRAN